MKTYQFYLPEQGEDPTDATEFDVPYDSVDLDLLAKFAAEELYNEHDGVLHQWPLKFVILDENGNELGSRIVRKLEVVSFTTLES